MTIFAFGIPANFSGEIHHWTILKKTISRTIFWTQIRVIFLLFHDFWYFCFFHDFSMTTNFSMTFNDCGNPVYTNLIGWGGGSYHSKLAARFAVKFCTGWAHNLFWYIVYIWSRYFFGFYYLQATILHTGLF